MTSTKERQQRAAARARLAREMTERQDAARRRRQRNAMLGAATALVLIVAGVALGVTSLGDDESDTPPVAGDVEPGGGAEAGSDECLWLPEDSGLNEHLREVGTPPPGEPRSGVQTMTLTTNHGVVEVEMDTAKVPCTAASFAHLAATEFYDGSACHRLVTENIYVLQCGDPSGTSQGGPTYRYAEENLPVNESPTYPKGTVAMANTGAPASTGGQFFIVYEDTPLPPDYTVVGTLTAGMEIVEEVAAAGHDGSFEPMPGGGLPNVETVIETLRVSDPT